MTGHKFRFAAPAAWICASLAIFLAGAFKIHAQEPPERVLAPPVNHESGRIEQILTARDGEFRYRAYVLSWRDTHIVVAGAPDDLQKPGDTRDIVVYRSEVNGRKTLRFAAPQTASDEWTVQESSTTAAITLGTARIEQIVTAESDGYRYLAYYISWHDQHVAIVDSRADFSKAVGDKLDFKVLRTGMGEAQRLAFSL